jgi:DNA replication protein DnaC
LARRLAIALGLKAVQAGYRVHDTAAADLGARTSRAADQGRWENTMRFCAGPQVLIVDELGYLPMVGEAGSRLFQVITAATSEPDRVSRRLGL